MLDIMAGLEARGWQVDLQPFAGGPRWQRALTTSAFDRVPGLRSLAGPLRRLRRELAIGSAASAWFREIDEALARREHDVVMVYLDQTPLGLGDLLARSRRPVVIISQTALTQERRWRHALAIARTIATLTQPAVHRSLLRASRLADNVTVAYATQHWRRQAERAGVKAARIEVISLGVRVGQAMPMRSFAITAPAQLLWVGRLSPEKGLEHFLRALPLVTRTHAVRLKAIAAPGVRSYEAQMHVLVRQFGLQDIVSIEPAVPRDDMIRRFSSADLLLFHSVFGEPVAQVMLHAAAAGLPIVGPRSGVASGLLRDDTAWCFADTRPEVVADAVGRALANEDDRRLRAVRFWKEVHDRYNLAVTIERFDAALRQRIAATSEAPRL